MRRRLPAAADGTKTSGRAVVVSGVSGQGVFDEFKAAAQVRQ